VKLTRLGHRPEPPDSLVGEQRLNKLEAGVETFEIRGTRMNRGQVVAWLCDELVDGMIEVVVETKAGRMVYKNPPDIVDLCEVEGAPRLSQVMAWVRLNPEWKLGLAEAERISAARRVNEARKIARRAQGQAQAGGSKLTVDTLLWEAGKLDSRFADKKGKDDDGFDPGRQDEAGLVELFMAAVMAQPELIRVMAPQIKECLTPEQAAELERAAHAQLAAESITVEVVP
jgi:hypothetical protein